MTRRRPGLGRIFGILTGFLVLGTPFAYLAWENLSLALTGAAGGRELGLMAVGLAGLLVLAGVLARYVRRLEEDD